MGAERLRGLTCVSVAIVCQSAAAALGKQAGLWSAGRPLAAVVLNPWYVASLAALGLQAVVWIMALRQLPLSFAYPFMSLVLPLNLLLAVWLFGETTAWNHFAGIAIVVCGVTLVSRETGDG